MALTPDKSESDSAQVAAGASLSCSYPSRTSGDCGHCPECRINARISTLETDKKRLSEALALLEHAEAMYRLAHDLYGGGDIRTGRAWDSMRRAGNTARTALQSISGERE